MSEASSTPPPWHAAFPTPLTTNPPSITPSELLQRMNSGAQPGVDFLLIDLRRTDHEGGTIHGSLNLPAQTLYPSLPTLHSLCKSAKISTVIFYCGSSRGRGTRAASWFADYLSAQPDTTSVIQSLILLGGISAWASAGPEYTALINGYDPTLLKIKT